MELTKELVKKHDALSVRIGSKFSNGINTHREAIVFYVKKKKPAIKIAIDKRIPPTIDGMETDVVELKSDKFKIGKTSISKLSPKQQERMANGVRI